MPISSRWHHAASFAALALVAPWCGAQSAPAQAATGDDKQAASSSALDAELFYEIFLGELTTRSGDPGAGYALMLEAARRSGDAALYRRAADIALQSRSGEYALAAAKAWKEAQPTSREANRYVLQILIALNRIGETAGVLRQEIAQAPPAGKKALLAALPQMYGRASDKAEAARVVEEGLSDALTAADTGAAGWAVVGKLRLAAGDKEGALKAARQAQARDMANEQAVELALTLMEDNVPDAEPLVLQALAQQPSAETRMAYARALIGLQRLREASVQLDTVTKTRPELPEAWLLKASLEVQENRLVDAEASAQRFLTLAGELPDAQMRQRSVTQSYLLLAQIAEKRRDFAGAQAWLDRIENVSEVFGAQTRKASLLAKQGKLDQGRALLRNLPGSSPEAKRLKLLAEVQLLKDHQQYAQAFQVQGELVALAPDEPDALYDQAMLAEKAGQPDTMERLLRQLIAQNPGFHHAYNALGYAFADRGVRLQEARELIAKALAIVPGDPFVTDSMGWVEFRLGNAAEARRLLEDAYRARPDAEIAAHLGEVLWTLGERDAAVGVWREALRTNPSNQTLKDTLGRLGVTL